MNKYLLIIRFLLLLSLWLVLGFKSSTLAQDQDQELGPQKPTQSALYYQEFEDEDEFSFYETESTEAIYDPLEKFNRKIFVFNDVVDRYFIQYIAFAYRKGLPIEARRSIRNVLDNLYAPISTVNSLLQGKPDNAMASFSNFLINSTIGVFGIFDIAKKKSIYYNKEDFGQTLGHYKMGSGAYLMIPILGPSSARDIGGSAFDKSIHPLDLNFVKFGGEIDSVDYRYRLGLTLLSGIDRREALIEIIDDIRKDSFDPYATIRSAYLQKRAAEIKE